MAQQRGLVHIGFDELVTMLKPVSEHAPRCLFGYGEAEGDNRAHEALARSLKSPLMDKGRMLEGARNVLINIAGGPGMTLNEVQILMEEFNRHISDQTRLHFGASVDARLGQKITVTILSAVEGVVHGVAAAPTARQAARVESSPVSVPATPVAPPPHISEPEPAPAPAPVVHAREIEPAPAEPRISYVDSDAAVSPSEADHESTRVAAAAAAAVAAAPTGLAAKARARALAKQEQMQFEPVTRGRFEKSEPTIVDGQDLDVPTFLRRNVKVK
jgi:cell division protein FtsZ